MVFDSIVVYRFTNLGVESVDHCWAEGKLIAARPNMRTSVEGHSRHNLGVSSAEQTVHYRSARVL